MKTIATAAAAAAIMIMSATAWADEPKDQEQATTEPIVLSETEMDGVTAAGIYVRVTRVLGGTDPSSSYRTFTDRSHVFRVSK